MYSKKKNVYFSDIFTVEEIIQLQNKIKNIKYTYFKTYTLLVITFNFFVLYKVIYELNQFKTALNLILVIFDF